MSTATGRRFDWTTFAPILAAAVLVAAWGRHPGPAMAVVVAFFLVAAVLAAVHHAEVVAHRVGEPFGSLLLAVAVTVIEVALIVTLMVTGDKDTSTLARDTVFAAVMISVNGIVGLALVVGALKHHLAVFNPEGTGSALATVVALASVTLVLPRFTTSEPGAEFTASQLAFAAVASLVLYGMFVFTQTVRHRDFFLPVETGPGPRDEDGDGHADPPSNRAALASLGLLVAALVAVVGLAKVESTPIEDGVAAVGFPHAFVGVVIALLVLLPGVDRRHPRGRPQRRADQPQPGLRLGDGLDRPDHPHDRAGLDLARRAAGARPRADADRAALHHRDRRCADRGPRSGQAAGRRRPPGAAGVVHLLVDQALTHPELSFIVVIEHR